MTANTTQIAVVGAGIAGLSAAWALRQAGRACVVLEAEERCGGIIQTGRDDGFVYEGGPDSFLASKPAAVELCRELGLEEELIGTEPQPGGPRLLHRGKLEPLPAGWRMIAPTRLAPVLRSPLFSARTKAAVALRWGRATAPPGEEETVSAYLERRFGRRAGEALAETIAGPLLAGVYGGRADQMSAVCVQPGTARFGGRPIFLSLRGGMGTLVERLAERLAGSVRLGCRVLALEPLDVGFRLGLENGEELAASAIIAAVPAWAAASLLRGLDAGVAALLHDIPYASSVNINIGYRSAPAVPPGHGFLAGAKAAPLLACTFAHQKFAGRAPAGGALLRLFYRGAVAAEDDRVIIAHACGDLAADLKIRQTPDLTQVRRTPRALPLYIPGHAARLDRLAGALERHPRLALAGNAYDGVGVPDCIASGRAAAARVLAGLGG